MSDPRDPAPPPDGPERAPGPPPFAAYPGWGPGPPRPGAPYPSGQHPYGGPPRPRNDAVSLVALVLSLTFCLSIVGAILGVVGLFRTSGGRRTGRWAALTAVIVGGALTAAGVVAVVLVSRTDLTDQGPVTVETARVGQCVDITEEEGIVTLYAVACDETHDAQVVQKGSPAPELFEPADAETFCRADMPQERQQQVDMDPRARELRWTILTGLGRTGPYLCYVELPAGDLDAPILD